jgi:hypothetical protein
MIDTRRKQQQQWYCIYYLGIGSMLENGDLGVSQQRFAGVLKRRQHMRPDFDFFDQRHNDGHVVSNHKEHKTQ